MQDLTQGQMANAMFNYKKSLIEKQSNTEKAKYIKSKKVILKKPTKTNGLFNKLSNLF